MVKIYRENNEVDHEIPYKVFIDNVQVFEIIEDEIKSIKLEPGIHKISARSDKYKSNELEFEETGEGILEFLIEPDYTDNAISKFFTSTLYDKRILHLKIYLYIFFSYT